jgi:hypothetical protein
MGWRVTGDIVRERGRRCLSEYAQKYLCSGVRDDDPLYRICVIDVPIDWLKSGFVDGYDAELFLSPQERYAKLSPQQRQENQEASLNRCREPEKNGRPIGVASRQAATAACYFYEAWRTEHRKKGINDYGHRSEMRDIAAQAVIEDLFAWMFGTPKFAWRLDPAKNVEAFFHIVRVLMDKPLKRRHLGEGPGDGPILDILASPDGLILHLPPEPRSK